MVYHAEALGQALSAFIIQCFGDFEEIGIDLHDSSAKKRQPERSWNLNAPDVFVCLVYSLHIAHCKLDRCQCTIRQRLLKLINCIILLGYDRGLKGHGVLDSISACHLIISACIRGSWSLCGRISIIRSCVRSLYTLRACFLDSRSL
jgi:hypothetical protein